jgi:hypothetical protein
MSTHGSSAYPVKQKSSSMGALSMAALERNPRLVSLDVRISHRTMFCAGFLCAKKLSFLICDSVIEYEILDLNERYGGDSLVPNEIPAPVETEEVVNLDVEQGEAMERREADKFSDGDGCSDTETVRRKDTPDSPTWPKRYTNPCVSRELPKNLDHGIDKAHN